MSWTPVDEEKIGWFVSGWEAALSYMQSNWPDFMDRTYDTEDSPFEDASLAADRYAEMFRKGPG